MIDESAARLDAIAARLDAIAARLYAIAEKLESQARPEALAPARPAVRMPRFSSGRRPRFWHDDAVREWVLAHHRRMTVKAALDELVRLFGRGRAPSRSALARIWREMDRA